MILLNLSPSSTTSLSLKRPSLLPAFKLKYAYGHSQKLNQRGGRNGACRAEFSRDAPFAVAIGACILNSLVFSATSGPDDNEAHEADSVIDSADARFAVMGIISFIPYFNWLSWVFAWLDTGKRRYAVYALVYLAPYLRSNLSLSPEESWLPIASILLCIIHIQLEASIKNGDLEGFQLLSQFANHFSSISKKIGVVSKDQERVSKQPRNLPSAEEQSRNEIRSWGVPTKPSNDPEHLNEDGEANE